MRSIAAAFAVFIPLASLSGAQLIRQPEPVQVAYDRERDFSRLRTYAWMKSQKPLPNMANHIRVTNAVIWFAQESHDSLTPDKVEREINDAAARVFGKYPTGKPDSPKKD